MNKTKKQFYEPSHIQTLLIANEAYVYEALASWKAAPQCISLAFFVEDASTPHLPPSSFYKTLQQSLGEEGYFCWFDSGMFWVSIEPKPRSLSFWHLLILLCLYFMVACVGCILFF